MFQDLLIPKVSKRVVRITQIDGALPNLALMRIAAHHRARGDEIVWSRLARREHHEPQYDRVYGSCIFKFSNDKLDRFRQNFPEAIVGGTGSGSIQTVENVLGHEPPEPDYSGYPLFNASIGYTQRGCRLKCKFCVVPAKEGKNHSVATLHDIWRGDPYPRNLHLLDNDFFGQDGWDERLEEARIGKFKLCFSQGINVRMINHAVAEALSNTDFRDTSFNKRRLYVAWDNLKDEKIFFRGVELLREYGIKPYQLTAYMLIGFDKNETVERIMYRFNKMVELGIDPYPMPFVHNSKWHKKFQRWVITRAYRNIPFEEYDSSAKGVRFNQRNIS